MYGANSMDLATVLGQQKEKIIHPSYCANKMLNITQKNYVVTE